MNETTRSSRELTGGSTGLTSLFDEPEDLSGQVIVSSGPYGEALPVAGMTVGQVRQRFSSRFDIAPGSQGEVNGQDVSEDTVLREGQVLAFTYRSGEKGTWRAKLQFGGVVPPRIALNRDSAPRRS
jgi:hypothetical protein